MGKLSNEEAAEKALEEREKVGAPETTSRRLKKQLAEDMAVSNDPDEDLYEDER